MARTLWSSSLRRDWWGPVLIALAAFAGGIALFNVIEPVDALEWLAGSPRLLATIGLSAAFALAAFGLAAFITLMRVIGQKARISAALDNMTQALCMFDRNARLIICNERYLELYGLPRERAYPGCTLRELLEFRKAAGTFFQDPDAYVANVKQRVLQGKIFGHVVEINGRIISIANRPFEGSGWVSTHEDITE